MKNKKLLWCILAIGMLAGHIMVLTGNGKLAQVAEAVEITETKLSENTVYDGSVVIKRQCFTYGRICENWRGNHGGIRELLDSG